MNGVLSMAQSCCFKADPASLALSRASHLSSRRDVPDGNPPPAVTEVEEIRHEYGPRPAEPLLRGSICVVMRNPYAGRYVPDIMPMMEALKPLGLEMAQTRCQGAGR